MLTATAAMTARLGATMATLTVRNLDDAVVRRLRIRAAERGRSAEAEHREILKMVLTDAEPPPSRQQAAERLAEFRRRTAGLGRGTSSSAELLAETRTERLQSLTGTEP
jgi:antitoxin FitA